jgi:predicted aminopeptidase
VDFAYLVPAAVAQLDLLGRVVPVEQAIESGKLNEKQIAKLNLILDARIFARDVIGLDVGDNYTTFYDSGGKPVAFNLSASRKDAFAPKTWTFPLVGTVPYLGYFNQAAAEAKRQELQRQDFDVFIYQIDAYSGIGYFANPILSPMLERDEFNLVDTVIHEMLHNTVWRASDTSFNESLATFFGRRGAEAYFSDRYPDEPGRVEEAFGRFEDVDRYSDFALELYGELDAFYSSDLPSERKIADRRLIFEAGARRFVEEVGPLMNYPSNYEWVSAGLPVNNAWMLGIRRYNLDLGVFERVFEATGQDWGASLDAFRAAADADEPYVFLELWLESGASPSDLARSPRQKTHSDDMEPDGAGSGVHRGPCQHNWTTTLLPTE